MAQHKSFARFLIVWFGQLISMIGIGLTAFSLGVYAFETTNTATAVALITLFAFVPNILLRPIGGVLADRYDRRLMMIVGDLGAALGLLFIYLMIVVDSIQLWHIYVGVSISSIFSAIQAPAYRASATDLLDEKDFSKGSGLVQLAESAKFLFSPIIAGVLLSITTIDIILVINMMTYALAIVAVFVIRNRLKAALDQEERKPWYYEIAEGWSTIKNNRGVLLLVVVVSIVTFYLGFLETLIGPMLLSFTTAKTLGMFQSISAIGMLISSLLIGVFTITKRYSSMLVTGLVLAGIAFAILGTSTNIYMLILAGFLFLGALPFVNTSADVLVRRNIPNDKQGRVWGIIGILSQIGFIVAYSTAGVLADKLFNPLLVEGGALANSIGSLIGVGPGRGIGLMFIIAGLLVVVVALITTRIQSIKSLDEESNLHTTQMSNIIH